MRVAGCDFGEIWSIIKKAQVLSIRWAHQSAQPKRRQLLLAPIEPGEFIGMKGPVHSPISGFYTGVFL